MRRNDIAPCFEVKRLSLEGGSYLRKKCCIAAKIVPIAYFQAYTRPVNFSEGFAMPAIASPGKSRGFIIPIGGAEDRTGEREILKRFLGLCGRKPTIAIIPTASRKEDTGKNYQELFRDLDCANTEVLNFTERDHCDSPSSLEFLSHCDGVFITGGNQLRLSTTIGGTPVAKILRRRNADGMPVGGTSAGAAIIPEHMIASGDEGPTPRARMVQLAPGLGLSNKIMVDQHFRQRDRLGRLLSAIALNPFAIGLGIDEDTAAFIGPDNIVEVVGSGTVTFIDPFELDQSSVADADAHDPIQLTNLRLSVLKHGGRFHLDTRRAL
jgi:cyanophycinase